MDATMENKMGLPPPYEPQHANPPPPPSYFSGGAPPPPGLVVGPSAPPVQVNQTRTTVLVHQQKMGPGPTGVQCPSCNKQVVSRAEYTSNNRTHIISAALCVVAGCCCACFIPYCMRSCKTANHFCPNCKAFLGSVGIKESEPPFIANDTPSVQENMRFSSTPFTNI